MSGTVHAVVYKHTLILIVLIINKIENYLSLKMLNDDYAILLVGIYPLKTTKIGIKLHFIDDNSESSSKKASKTAKGAKKADKKGELYA